MNENFINYVEMNLTMTIMEKPRMKLLIIIMKEMTTTMKTKMTMKTRMTMKRK